MKKLLVTSLVISGLLAVMPVIAGAATVVSGQSSASIPCFVFNSNLWQGERDLNTNGQVSVLQNFLHTGGYLSVSSTGYFGPMTLAAVKNYQNENGVPTTGFVGPLTRGKINMCNPIVPPNPIPNPTSSIQIVSPSSGVTLTRGTIEPIVWTDNTYYSNSNYPNYLSQNLYTITITKTFNYYCPTGEACAQPMMTSGTAIAGPMIALAPFTIAQNVPLTSSGYQWNVGTANSSNYPIAQYSNGSLSTPASTNVPDGTYTMQICESGTSDCNYNQVSFTIGNSQSSNDIPVINGVSAPTSLSINQAGTWTVSASDPQNEQLSYSVNWGDNPCSYGYACPMLAVGNVSASSGFQQSTSFTHSYSQAGVYTQTFTVMNTNGQQAHTSTTVQIGNTSTGTLSLNYLSPQSGSVGTQVTIYGSGFTPTGNQVRFGTDAHDNLNNISSNGQTLVFTIPSGTYYSCFNTVPSCALPIKMTTPGTYPITVVNSNGTSNTLYFTVTY